MIPTLDPVIASLTKDSNMGSKPILESATDVLALPHRDASGVNKRTKRELCAPIIRPGHVARL
jgi:hypothetical protein